MAKFFKKGRKRATTRRPRAVRARRGRKSSVSVGVKSYVKKMLHTAIENKCVQINGGVSFGSVNESPDFNAYPMCPLSGYWSIPQGVGQGGRVANVIKTRSVKLSYVLRPTPYDAVYNPNPIPCQVQLLLGYVKNTPCFAPVGGDINQLFQSGSSVTAPVGSLRDIISVINKDYWVIKKRWNHKLGYAATTGTGGLPGQEYNTNNDFKLNVVKTIDITNYIPATHIFNDSGVTTNTKNLFFMYYCVSANGGVLANPFTPCNIEFWVDFTYEDA